MGVNLRTSSNTTSIFETSSVR